MIFVFQLLLIFLLFPESVSATGVEFEFSTYFGGSLVDYGEDIVLDRDGNIYVTGITLSTDFPTLNAFQGELAGGIFDIFVLKLDPSGQTLLFSTFLGGSDGDIVSGVNVDNGGNVIVTGYTKSVDFPTYQAIQSELNGTFNDIFISKLSDTGDSMVFSTYLGGSADDYAMDMDVDHAGDVYVTGITNSIDFPTVHAFMGEFSGVFDVLIMKLDTTGGWLDYATYFGGHNLDRGYGLVVDQARNVYITGSVSSENFPTFNSFQGMYGGGSSDCFISKLDPAGVVLLYSTYLGGSSLDQGLCLDVDSNGNVFVTGSTNSVDFPTFNAFQREFAGVHDVFVTKLVPPGDTITYSTYLGGSQKDLGYGIAADYQGKSVVTGLTFSPDFPLRNALQDTNGGYEDVFITRFIRAGSFPDFSSYLGGLLGDVAYDITVDGMGNLYPTGITASVNFPTKNALQKEIVKDSAFITKIISGYEFELCQGLNLISLPFEHGSLNKSAAVLDSICQGKADTIWKYDCTSNSFISWTQLDPGRGWKCRAGMPLWVNIIDVHGCQWEPEGTVPGDISFKLCTGLNLVSIPVYSASLRKASDLLSHMPDCNAVWRVTTATDCTGGLAFPGYYDISSDDEDFSLVPGRSYWVNLTAPGIWTPPNP